MRRALVALLLFSCIAPHAHALTADEHRRMALLAFEPALESLGVTISAKALAEITVLTSRDDMSPSRFQVRGLTPYQQATAISPERMEEIVADVIEHPPTDNAFAPYADNAVANYLVYHTLALRCAEKGHPDWDTDPPPRMSHEDSEWVERALVYEAVALGYLGDCFSSSHILTPRHLWLAGLQGVNVRTAHDFFATQGAYVFSTEDGVWQTFGDGLLRWHGRAWFHAVKACRTSVGEVMSARDSTTRLEAIPVPVVATWNAATQLSEDGLHAPDLRVDRRFLYSRNAFPPWYTRRLKMHLEDDLDHMLENDPDIESVEYHQTLDAPPAWAGLLLMTGGGVLMSDDGGGGVASVAAGYGWEFWLPLLARLRTSLETEYVYRLGEAKRRVIEPRYTVGIGTPLVPLVEAIHFEMGYAWGLESPFRDQGVKWGVGAGTKPLRFPFTYAGVSVHVKYERFWLDETLDGFQLQLVFR